MITHRWAGLTDASDIAALHTQSWRQAYRGILPDAYLDGNIADERAQVWQKRLVEPATNQRLLVAEEAGQLAGFICLFLDEHPQLGTLIDNLHVAPTMKGQRIGSGLMHEAARLIIPQATQPGFHLMVYETNQPAIQFYNRLGGRPTSREWLQTPGSGQASVLRYVWETIADLR